MDQSLKNDPVVTRIDEVVTADMDGEMVMLSIKNGKYYGIDEVGSRIWELLAEPKKVSELVQLLSGEYEVAQEQCRSDIEEFYIICVVEGLVKLD